MKKTLCLLLAVLFTVTAAAALVGVTVAWLTDGLYAQRFPDDFSGSSDLAYFAGGDGTADNPYEISTPVHLYNLAWLQYLGYFNRKDGLNNDLDQTYFKLTDNVSMASFNSALPPIGTEEHPFIGHFDGNGYTISNVTVSNTGTGKNALSIHPTTAVFDESGILRTAGNTAAVSIVGLFGVIGDIAINGASYVDTYAEGKDGFDKTAMAVGGFYADGLHIRSYTAETLCGLAAGWVGANLAHVGVYQGDFVFATGATGIAALLDDGDSATTLSKYSLVGNYDKDLVGWDLPTSGDDPGWGGSIDMKNVYTRADTFYNSVGRSEYDSSTFDPATDTGKYRYIDEKQGTFYYGSYENHTTGVMEGIIYLTGGQKYNGDIASRTPSEGETPFYIYQGDKYLTFPDSNAKFTAVSREEAVTWCFTEEGYLYAYNNDKKQYLNVNWSGRVLTLSETPSSKWVLNKTYDSEQDAAYQIATVYWTTGSGVEQYSYIELNGTAWRGQLTGTPTNYLSAAQAKRKELYSGYLYEDAGVSWVTHFPLNTYDEDGDGYRKYDVNPKKNTGYVISGSSSGDIGDLRLYRTSSASLSASFTGTYGAGSTMKIYTRTAGTGGFVSFDENYGSAAVGKGKGLVKYAAAKIDGLDALLGGADYIYGLHFMNAAISMDKIMKAPYAWILGEEYTNYAMPANSINFQTADRGYINFFAGTYYGSTPNFFSLHEIFRNDDNTIAAIKEISKIYGTSTGNADYIYEYTDGTFSGGYTAIPNGYEEKFDCAWITDPGTLTPNAVYYMEIPVNAGEYALGSADTGDGAYLMYLDIGANATGGGETPSDTDYNLDSVDFVNTDASGVERDASGAVIDSSWPSYAAVVVTLSDATGTAPYIVFRRGDATGTDENGAITAILYYRTDGTLTVAPLPKTDATEDNTTLSPPADRTTG